MSLQKDCWSKEIPPETAKLGQSLLDETDVYRLVGEEVQEVLSLEMFESMYSQEGRGGICPIVLALVTIFQFLENLPDREAAKWAVVRLDWKYALHMPLEWVGFHYSTLCNFRKRLMAHRQERLLFDTVLTWVQKHGFLKKRGKQRTDATHVIGQVANLSRLEMLWETLRLALGELTEVAEAWSKDKIPAVFHDRYGKRQQDWQLSKAEVKQATRQAGEDGFWLLDRITENAPEAVQSLEAVSLLHQIWEQQFSRGDNGKIRLHAGGRGQGKEMIVSPHEPEARWSKKRDKTWQGYKVHQTETVDREAGQAFLTDVTTSAANVGDNEMVEAIQNRLQERGLAPKTQFVDQSYVSGRNLAHSQERKIELFGPVSQDSSGKPTGYQQQDFCLDFETKTATCPQGRTAIAWYDRPQADGYVGATIRFGQQCLTCPAREQCAPGKSGRTLEISPYHTFLQARRSDQGSPAFAQQMKQRAAIEGTLSEAVRKHGARRARYRGQAKVLLQQLLIGTAINLKRLARGLDHRRQQRMTLVVTC
jgi:transposase